MGNPLHAWQQPNVYQKNDDLKTIVGNFIDDKKGDPKVVHYDVPAIINMGDRMLTCTFYVDEDLFIRCKVPLSNNEIPRSFYVGSLDINVSGEKTLPKFRPFLGQGSTYGNLVDDIEKTLAFKNVFPIHKLGKIISPFFSIDYKNMATLVSLCSDVDETYRWSEKMEDFNNRETTKSVEDVYRTTDEKIVEKILAFAQKYGRPPLMAECFGQGSSFDELRTGKILSFPIFQKDLPVFTNVEYAKGRNVYINNFEKVGSNINISLIFSSRDTIQNVEFFLPDAKMDFRSVWEPRDQKTQTLKFPYQKILGLAARNLSAEDFQKRFSFYGGNTAAAFGIILEGVLTEGRFDLNIHEKEVVKAFCHLDVLSSIKFNRLSLESSTIRSKNGGSHKIISVVATNKANQKKRWHISDNGKILSARFLLAGIDALEEKRVVNAFNEKDRGER